MTSGRWLLAALATAGTLAGWVALAGRVPRVEPPEPIASPEATSVEPASLEPASLEPAPPVDVTPDVTSSATRRRGRR